MLRSGMDRLFGTWNVNVEIWNGLTFWDLVVLTKRKLARSGARPADRHVWRPLVQGSRLVTADSFALSTRWTKCGFGLFRVLPGGEGRKEAVLQRPSPSPPWIAVLFLIDPCRRWSLEERFQDDMQACSVTRWVKLGIQKIVPLRKRVERFFWQ
jgi:hypothetical protein